MEYGLYEFVDPLDSQVLASLLASWECHLVYRHEIIKDKGSLGVGWWQLL